MRVTEGSRAMSDATALRDKLDQNGFGSTNQLRERMLAVFFAGAAVRRLTGGMWTN